MSTLVLWGFHPSHGNVPLKLCDWTRKEQRDRERDGWTCYVYRKGDAPVGLALEASKARGA